MSISNNKWPAIAATGLAGVITGCLTFVSAVDVRSFLTHVASKDTKIIQQHFPVWWPNGRDLMVPLLISSTLAHASAFWTTANRNWAISGVIIMLIGPYTAMVLGEDIETLRKAEDSEVAKTAKRFCNLHHFRLVMALAGFGLSLVGLAEM